MFVQEPALDGAEERLNWGRRRCRPPPHRQRAVAAECEPLQLWQCSLLKPSHLLQVKRGKKMAVAGIGWREAGEENHAPRKNQSMMPPSSRHEHKMGLEYEFTRVAVKKVQCISAGRHRGGAPDDVAAAAAQPAGEAAAAAGAAAAGAQPHKLAGCQRHGPSLAGLEYGAGSSTVHDVVADGELGRVDVGAAEVGCGVGGGAGKGVGHLHEGL